MTLFIAFNLDAAGMAERRTELLPAHRAYMAVLGDKVLWGGPLLDSDGETKLGGMYVFRAATLADARAITAADPFVSGGVYRQCETHRWRWQSGPPVVTRPGN
ncbi:YciI family protein [Frigidibacter sp. SD6-1]|uniref:YciI family protein n=1 Tax=Frigidibacter sp. SD6-1 TaxID=3032581 RepID=UPI0024DF762A|nr:YciI family protein [Frigidibacter sp. SD6-1]